MPKQSHITVNRSGLTYHVYVNDDGACVMIAVAQPVGNGYAIVKLWSVNDGMPMPSSKQAVVHEAMRVYHRGR
jgi:hypothetical protein